MGRGNGLGNEALPLVGDRCLVVQPLLCVNCVQVSYLDICCKQAARSAITGNGDSGAGAPLQDPQPSSEAATPAAAPDAAAATGGQRLGGSEDSEKAKVVDKWFGEDVAIAEGYGGEIETALGVVLEQV